jgi:hypothetical protein
MNSIVIRLVGVDINANGVVAIVSITIVLLTFLVLYRPPSALWSSIFERLWHWYEKHRTNKIPRIPDNQTTLSPAEPQMPLWDDAAPEKSTARHLRADELPNLALGRNAFGSDRSETSNAAPPRKEISN